MDISELAQELSKATNETWLPRSIDGGEMVLYCTSLDHEEMLYIRAEKGRLHIWGSLNGLHKFIPYKAEQPKITADINKTPYVIARDIARRLLPDYRSLLGICMERKQANDEYQSHKQVLADSLCKTGICHLLEYATNGETLSLVDSDNVIGLDFRATVNEHSVRFDYLDLSADLALKVFTMLANEAAQ